MVACTGLSIAEPTTLVGLPFLLMFAAGYLWVGAAQAVEDLRRPRHSSRRRTQPALDARGTDDAAGASPVRPVAAARGGARQRGVGPRVS
jgi:hypothetical protein